MPNNPPAPPIPFHTDETFRQWARQAFIDNECGSDEYRESQPWKLLAYIGEVAPILQDDRYEAGGGDRSRRRRFLDDVKTWVAACGTWYEGCDEAVPVCETVFDILWEEGRHPYGYTPAELAEMYNEDYPEAPIIIQPKPPKE